MLDAVIGCDMGFSGRPIVTSDFFTRCMEWQRGLAMRKLSFRPSVSLSVKRVHCDGMFRFFYTIQKII